MFFSKERRHRVVPASSKGMAAANSLECQQASGHRTMLLYCLLRVLGTRRSKAATAGCAK